MAVPKVAVIALVAIIAVPILLGYAMNLNEVSITDYKVSDGDPVNVTSLLMNGSNNSVAYGDAYQLNTKFDTTWDDAPLYPIYNKTNQSTSTTFPFRCDLSSDSWNGETVDLTDAYEAIYTINYDYSAGSYISAAIYSGTTLIQTYNWIKYIQYDRSTDTINYIRWTGPNNEWQSSISGGNYTSIVLSSVGGQTATRYYGIMDSSLTSFTDLSKGFYFVSEQTYNNSYRILMPEKTRSALVSVDLDSITASSYSFSIGVFTLTKTTTGGVVSWTVSSYYMDDPIDLYYNPGISHNTYQILFEHPDTSRPSSNPGYPDPYREYYRHVQFRYAGDWPEFIGEANYYQKYDIEYWTYSTPANSYMKYITVSASSTPTLRVDAAQFQAFEYNVIENNTYTPSDFRTNPATKITNITEYGTQIVYGGHTYNISSDNKITIGSKSVSLDGLVFNSVPNELGTYDNRIGNTVISTSAIPSDITFNGKWQASISTSSMEQYTYTKTEWIAGSFAWDGMDDNFLLVGLITSLAVFIALGIYGRRSGRSVLPLMLVCGGAALLFFIMI